MIEERGSFCGSCEDWGSLRGSLRGSFEDKGSFYDWKGMGGFMLRLWFMCFVVKKDWNYDVKVDFDFDDDSLVYFIFFFCFLFVFSDNLSKIIIG